MERSPNDYRGLRVLPYALTIFLSAFLLFEVQPLIAKYILPWFGGAPAVWTTCMLFFQVLLLGGYAYAHLIGSRLTPGAQKWLHLVLLLASVLLLVYLGRIWDTPITPGADWKPHDSSEPVGRIMAVLGVSLGLPYFILSSTGPLLQSWFGRTSTAVSPYRLYALSNLGSLLALLGYPFLIEWVLPLRAQARVWCWMYAGFAVCCGFCAATLSAKPMGNGGAQADANGTESDDNAPARSTPGQRAMWLGLAACGSAMLLATTNQLCLNVAAVPLLWVLPLALYLLSFILCFQNARWYRREIYHPAFGVGAALACYALYHPSGLGLVGQVVIYSLALFSCCMVCHGELVRLKPPTRHLTAFYLFVAGGGALGGAFVSLLSPHLFRGYWEYHVAFWGSALLALIVLWAQKDSWLYQARLWLPIVIIVAACFLPVVVAFPLESFRQVAGWRLPLMALIAVILIVKVTYRTHRESGGRSSPELAKGSAVTMLIMLGGLLLLNARPHVILAVRNFYGVLSIENVGPRSAEWQAYGLSHGPILHGFQYSDPAKQRYPTSYYGRLSAIGLTLLNHPKRLAERPEDRHLRIGALGLGIGTIAAYGEPGDYFRFYEINPQVVRLANSKYFTYLKNSQARVDVILGDARLSMENELARNEPQQFDVLVLDAFAGDAIPVHLLTSEAFAIYLRHLRRPGGVIAVHISNRFVDLRPVLWKVAERFALHPAWFHAPQDERIGSPNDWVLLDLDHAMLDVPQVKEAIKPTQSFGSSVALWTDDYSNMFRILRR